jgi:ribulose-bisphosphate carboxylase large chain
MLPSVSLDLSGERFGVVYRLTGDEAAAHAKAHDICLEQTVEFPDDLVPAGDIREHIVGQIVSFEPADTDHFEAVISYAVETSGFELPQLINVVFGNISIKPGIRVERLDLPSSLLQAFKGPRFGRKGLRALLHVPERPLLCTALKPMGLGLKELADLTYLFALGGIDIIKDDHGLANQAFAPFRERVQRCVEAVERANRETGRRCIYMPNVAAPADEVAQRALFAKQTGAGGVLIAPGLTGLDTMRQLADDDRIALPIMSHPAFQGSFVTSRDSGVSHYALFGQIARLAGADASIYPNYGGRFSFSRDECQSIAEGTAVPMAHLKTSFPTPGGGMSLARVPEMRQIYGRDVIFLIGGGLHKQGPDVVENCRYFLRLVEQL